jgi:hypothetical protein
MEPLGQRKLRDTATEELWSGLFAESWGFGITRCLRLVTDHPQRVVSKTITTETTEIQSLWHAQGGGTVWIVPRYSGRGVIRQQIRHSIRPPHLVDLRDVILVFVLLVSWISSVVILPTPVTDLTPSYAESVPEDQPSAWTDHPQVPVVSPACLETDVDFNHRLIHGAEQIGSRFTA